MLFTGNKAHSISDMGLKFDGTIVAYRYPCQEFNQDSNPTLNNIISNSFFWKVEGGAIYSDRIGHFTFRDIDLLNNKNFGIFLRQTSESPNQKVIVTNTRLVGKPPDNIGDPNGERIGIELPSTSGFLIDGCTFYYFTKPDYAIRVCSECDMNKEPNEYEVQKLTFFDVNNRLIFAKKARLEKIIDLDGSLAGKEARASILPFYNSANVAPCQSLDLLERGLYCSPKIIDDYTRNAYDFSPVTIKFFGASDNMDKRNLIMTRLGKIYAENETAPGDVISFQTNVPLNKGQGWCLMILPGYVYQFAWDGNPAVDFQKLTIETQGYNSVYKNILLKHNYLNEMQTYKLRFTTLNSQGATIEERDLDEAWYELSPVYSNVDGSSFYHVITRRLIYFILNGKKLGRMSLAPVGCGSNCEAKREKFFRKWSDKETWANKVVPLEGNDVTIPYERRVILDIDPPVLGNLYIDGELIFDEVRENSVIRATNIWVRKGEFFNLQNIF